MKRRYKTLITLMVLCMLAGCSETKTEETQSTDVQEDTAVQTVIQGEWEYDLEMIDMTKWLYHEQNDVYYQTGISYCSYPLDEEYETLGIYVPGAYFKGNRNADGTYTCEIDPDAEINGYTAQTAPIVFPVNTPGHKAQEAPDGFVKGCAAYTDVGFIYVLAGCRGKDAGVPAGVTDLKAAIRYIRFNEEILPGDMDRIAVFGHSGGGSQCATLGASGDSELYGPYLASLGAAPASDAVNAVMAWCPITGFDTADLGYEWNMGMTRSGLSEEMQQISDSLAEAFAKYINETGFTDEEGNQLTLETSDEGIYQAGSYYEFVKEVIEGSLEHYLDDQNMSEQEILSYIDSLNKDGEWVSYEDGRISIDSIASFVTRFKKASKPVAAFDKPANVCQCYFN